MDLEHLKSALLARNDALDYLEVAEKLLKSSELWEKKEAARKTFQEATDRLRNRLLGEYDNFNIKIKEHSPLADMVEVKKEFEDAISALPYQIKDPLKRMIHHRSDTREERLQQSLKEHKRQQEQGPAPKFRPSVPTEEPWETIPLPAPEEPKPATWKSPFPAHEKDQDKWLKVTPVIAELARLPKMNEDAADTILTAFEQGDSVEDVWEKLPTYYHEKDLNQRIQDVTDRLQSIPEDDVRARKRVANHLSSLEAHKDAISSMRAALIFLHKNWTPSMDKLSKQLNNYKITLGDKTVRLDITDIIEISAAIKFLNDREACDLFLNLESAQDVEKAFDVPTLLALEKKAADLASIVKPNTKGPSAEEEKAIVDVLVDWLNSSNAQGTEEDIVKMVTTHINEKAPDYHDENVARVARKTYAEWKASQPIPSEVGQEGKANVGVANQDGTGVFVEPNRGNSNVQNESPTTAVRKEAADHGADDIAKGVLIELEHTQKDKDRPATPEEAAEAKKIAEDHLKENPHYYDEAKLSPAGEEKLTTASLNEDNVCSQCDTGAHERCAGGGCSCGCRTSKESSLDILARIVEREDGWHVMSEKGKHLGGPYNSRGAAKKRLQQVEMFKHMKNANLEGTMFSVGDTAILNTRVGALAEGTEVTISSVSTDEVTFITGNILGITKAAHLDKASITKEAAAVKEKYPWDNDGLDYKFDLNDRVKVGSIESDGDELKGKEGTVREKVIVAANGDAEKFYLVELDGCGTVTLPEEALSKAAKGRMQAHREAALNHDELTKEAVLKPNFEVTQDFLNSYDHPPTVVTTADIEAWLSDPKNNYQYSKKDLKEIVKYLQSAKVEVRVPTKKETPEVLPEEEMAAVEKLEKEAKKYKSEQIKPDGSRVTIEKEIDKDLGAGFETEDPAQPGQKLKWTAASISTTATCNKCAGVGSLPCDCMEGPLWLSATCDKCKDEGALPCPDCKK